MKAVQPTTDKRRIRGEESRRQILNAAIDSIAKRGLGKLTLDQVADRVGISRGLVVFHFKSKNKLIMAVLAFLGEKYSGGWNAIIEEEFPSAMAKLIKLIEYDIGFACENPKYISAWHAFWGEAKGNVLYHEQGIPRDKAYAADIRRLLERISEEEGYKKLDLPSVTRGLEAMMFGSWVLLHLNPGTNDYEANMKAIRLYLAGIFPKTRISG